MKKLLCWLGPLLLTAGLVHAEPLQDKVDTKQAEGPSLTVRVPLFSREFSKLPVATVNGEQITLAEFSEALGAVHSGMDEAPQQGRKDYSRVLKRLVTARLIAQEARTMGMDELEEVKGPVANYRQTALRELLREQLVKDVKPDDAEVDRLYRESIREFRIRSLMFSKEADARAFVREVAAGKPFDELAGQALAARTARGSGETETVNGGDLNPLIADVLSRMKDGMVSEPVPIQPGFVVFRLESTQTVESREARERARSRVLVLKQHEALVSFNKKLSKKYLTFNTKRIEALDFASPEPGMEKLLKDRRVIVQVKGEKPVTVADLAYALEEKLFHGSGKTNRKQRLNKRKVETLEELLAKRLLVSEALRRRIDRTEEFKAKVKEYEDSALFGMFVQRVIGPEVAPTDTELRAYYDAHRGEFKGPAKVRFESVAFASREEAAEAAAKIKQGADVLWVRENAAGHADPTGWFTDSADQLVPLDGLPPELIRALTGAHGGDIRTAAGPDGNHYVLLVYEMTTPEPLPFEKAAEVFAQKVYDEKLQKMLDTWVDRLKKGVEVTVYLAENDR